MANLTANPWCDATTGASRVDLSYVGQDGTITSFYYEIRSGSTVVWSGEGGQSLTANDVANGTYTAWVYNNNDPLNRTEAGDTGNFTVDCSPPDPSVDYTVTCNTEPGAGLVDATINNMNVDTAYTYDLQILDSSGNLLSASGANRMVSRPIANVPTGSHTMRLIEYYNGTAGDTWDTVLTVDCGYAPVPGTVTPPAAKYMAVGGTLPNPIEYSFAFQVNDVAGDPKTGHYVKVNIYREGELTPFASTRQRVRNGAAVVDVSRFVKALVSSRPTFDSSLTVTTDPNAMAGFTIGFVEAWGTTTMAEVKENTVKYAVNAALQPLDGNYVEHVIFAS